MSKTKQKSLEELLEEALVPEDEQPYEVPGNWVWVRLGSISRFIDYRGKTPKKTESGIRLITAKNVRMGYIQDEPKEFISEKDYDSWMTRGIPNVGDILFTTEAPLGNVAQLDINEKIALAQRIITISPYQPLEKTFFKYCLMSPQMQALIKSNATGTTVSGIKASRLKEIEVPLAPLHEQKRIAEKVERLFAKIDEAKRLIEEVKGSFELRRAAILDKAFKGQLGTNDPNEQSMLEASDTIKEKDLIPKEEQPYEVPENWVWVRLGNFLPPMETRDPAKLASENFLYVDIDSIDNNKFEIREPKIIEIENAPSRAKRKIDKGDVIISLVRPYLRNVARVLSDDPRLVASTAFYVCKRNKVTETNYLYYYLITSFVTNYLNVRTKGHNAPSVRNSDFLEVPIPIPPVEEQKRIADKVDNLLSNLENKQELVLEVEQKLDLLKQAILNKAFRGELGTNDPTDEHAIELLKEVLKSK